MKQKLVRKNGQLFGKMDVRKFERFRKIRNAINYYGKTIEVDEAEELVLGIKQLINEILAGMSI